MPCETSGSRVITEGIMDGKAVAIIWAKQVGPRLSHRCRLLHLKHHLCRQLCRYMHQQQTGITQSYSPPSSMKTIEGAPLCRFCLVANHPTTQCPAISLQIRNKFVSTREASLLRLFWPPQWTPPRRCRGRNSTLNSLQSAPAANNKPLAQQRRQLGSRTVANASTM